MPYRVVGNFEAALCEYTGARYAVTTNSCTMALFLACKWHLKYHNQWLIKKSLEGTSFWTDAIEIPSRTYVSVPQSIIHAGGVVKFRDFPWLGGYQLSPYPIFDYARRFTSNMYEPQTFQCVSFHWNKILGIQQGGAILHDDPVADAWLRRMRFDGRTAGVAPKDDTFTEIGYHCYMSPETAAQGLVRLSFIPEHNDDLPNDDYPDLSQMDIFR